MRFAFLRRGFLLIAVLVGVAGAGQAQRLQPSQLQPDVALLREALVALHPGLYRHIDSVELDRRFAALSAGTCSRTLTVPEAYKAIARLLAGVRDGHTYLNPLNQKQSVRAALTGGATAVPFRFRLTPEKQLVVTQVLPRADGLPVGAEITKLDGRPIGEVIDTLLTATRGDGANDLNRMRLLWLDGLESVAAFDVLYPLFFPVGEKLRVEYRTAGADEGPARIALVPAVRAADREAALGKPGRPGAGPLGWRLDFPDARTARLTLPDFTTWTEPKFDWRRWLSESFYTIRQKKCSALILDVRLCEGGDDDVVTTLLPYLLKKPARLPPERQLWRTNHIPSELASMLDSWNPALKKMKPADFRPTADGFYQRVDQAPATAIVKPDPLAFQGTAFYALCGPRNASAAFRLLRVLKENQLATLIGQPTGGNRRGTTGGQMFFLRLPNTGLEVDLPLVSYQPLRAQPDEGLEPDEVVPLTLEAIRKGADVEMARVTQLLREARRE